MASRRIDNASLFTPRLGEFTDVYIRYSVSVFDVQLQFWKPPIIIAENTVPT